KPARRNALRFLFAVFFLHEYAESATFWQSVPTSCPPKCRLAVDPNVPRASTHKHDETSLHASMKAVINWGRPIDEGCHERCLNQNRRPRPLDRSKFIALGEAHDTGSTSRDGH